MIRQWMVAIALMCTSACIAQIDPAETVMTINGEAIKAADYYKKMEYLPGVGRILGDRFAEAPPGILTIMRIIDERLLLQLAAEQKVSPVDAEVDEEFAYRLKQDPKLNENLVSSGLNTEVYKYRLRLELAEFKLQTQGITITDQEVEKHYKDNPTRFTIPKGYKLRVIAVGAAADKEAVDKELASGKKFDEVAKALSKDPSKVAGGDIGILPEGSLSDVVKKALANTKIGQHTAWIQSESTSVMFFLEDVIAAKVQPLDADLRRDLRKMMMIERGQVKINLAKLLVKKRNEAKVELTRKEFQKIVDEYLRSPFAG